MLRPLYWYMATVVAAMQCLSGCGTGGGSDEPPKSARDVASLAKCSETYKDSGADKMMFATDGGTCDVSGGEVTISWFNTGEARNNYKKVGESMGGGDPVVYGANWAIECTDREPCQAVAKRTGGELS